jgi:hypothetical protein
MGGSGSLVSYAIGGAAMGFIEKQNLAFIPTLPFLGRKGTLTLIAYFWRKNGGPAFLTDIARAGAVLSGYDFVKTGSISGDDE